MLIKKGHDGFKAQGDQFKKIADQMRDWQGLELNTSASILGAVMSQEVIKVITKRDHPCHGLVVLDSCN